MGIDKVPFASPTRRLAKTLSKWLPPVPGQLCLLPRPPPEAPAGPAAPFPISLLPQQPGGCPARGGARPLSFHPPSTQAPYFCPFHFCFQPTSAPQPQPVAVANWNDEAAWKNHLICTGGEDRSKETSRLAADALSSTASCCERQFVFPACALAGGKLQAGCSPLGLPFLRAVAVVPLTACCYAPKARAQGGVHCARRFGVLKKKTPKGPPQTTVMALPSGLVVITSG